MFSRIRKTWKALRARPQWEDDLDLELRVHLDLRVADLIRSGLSKEAAERRARLELGSRERYRQEARTAYRLTPFDDLVQDLRYAMRQCRKNAGFTATAVFTLALGIGAATAVFSIMDAVLLQPLPYRDPDHLVAVWITSKREANLAKMFANESDYSAIRRESQTLTQVATASWAKQTGRVWTGAGPTREVMTIPVSASFFDLLGALPSIGRTFLPEDEHSCALVLSYGFWRSKLGGDASAVGRSMTLDKKPCSVIGVMPSGFRFYPRQTEVWILLPPEMDQGPNRELVGIFARLKPGIGIAQAQTELRQIFQSNRPSPESKDLEPVVFDLHDEFTFLAGRTLQTTLVIVFVAVLFLLLIACLNVANLMLGRLTDRQREFALRSALGSGRARLVRQLLTESLMLSMWGTVIGLGLAVAFIRVFRAMNPIELGVSADVTLNLPVLLFSGVLTAAATVILGLLPAIRTSRTNAAYLKLAGRGVVRGRQHLASAIIAMQMAVSFVLLSGAGLLFSSAVRMAAEPLGFEPDRVVSMRLTLPAARYSGQEALRAAHLRLLERLKASPDFSGVALASKAPPEAGGNQTLEVAGRPGTGKEEHDVGGDAVSPAFFESLKVPLLKGRNFDSQDGPETQPVAVVNQALVREYFPDGDVLGRQIRIPGGSIPGGSIPGGSMPWLTIVGVVGNLKHTVLMNEMQWVETPILYRPLSQEPRRTVSIVARAVDSRGDQFLKLQVADFDAELPIAEVETAESRIAFTMAYPRFRALVFGLFAISALLLSAVGLHGVLSELVSHRTGEFGVRRALGAETRHLLSLVVIQSSRPVLAGLAAGVAATQMFSRFLGSLLYGIQPTDPTVLTAVSLGLILVSALATLWPARRAAGVDPALALKAD